MRTLPRDGLGGQALRAWDRACEVAMEKHPRGLTPIRLPLHSGQAAEYHVEDYTVEFVGPEWWRMTCTCKATEFGRVICHHKAIVAAYRLTEEEVVSYPSVPAQRCPWCNKEGGDMTAAGYHVACEFDILSANADELRENSRLAFHGGELRRYYAKDGLTIPIHPGKRTPLDALWD